MKDCGKPLLKKDVKLLMNNLRPYRCLDPGLQVPSCNHELQVPNCPFNNIAHHHYSTISWFAA